MGKEKHPKKGAFSFSRIIFLLFLENQYNKDTHLHRYMSPVSSCVLMLDARTRTCDFGSNRKRMKPSVRKAGGFVFFLVENKKESSGMRTLF